MQLNESSKRWFSTGRMAAGVGSVAAEVHTLNDAAVIRAGEAKGHDLWIDGQFCADVVRMATELGDKGVKARFGHPDMCSDALGSFLGRWKGFKLGDDGVVRGSLHLSSTAAESPRGDLRKYIEEMAAKEPDHFGCSIVFSRDTEAEDVFATTNLSAAGAFQSPDPANVRNLRHARLSAIHAADLVDDPAATDGMFSGAGGAALAARVSEWLDTHPEVLRAFGAEPEMLTIIERYSDELRPFVARYNANHPMAEVVQPEVPPVVEAPDADDPMAKCPGCGMEFDYVAQPEVAQGAVACPGCGVPVTQDNIVTPEPDAESPVPVEEQQAPKPAAPPLAAESAPESAELDATKAELAKVSAELAAARDAIAAAELARVEAEAKAAALESGQAPLSAAPGEGNVCGSLMQRARKVKN